MMTDVSKPVAKNMTPRGELILEILRSNGDWMTRSEIAEQIAKHLGKSGKTRYVLNKWDTALLELLISQELIQVEERNFHGKIGFMWVYRAAEEGGN